MGFERLLAAALRENVGIPQLQFAPDRGMLPQTPEMVMEEILEGPLFMFLPCEP